jgi:hypothetical protein
MIEDELREIFAHGGGSGTILRVDAKVNNELVDLCTLRVVPSLTIVQRLEGFLTRKRNKGFVPDARL